MEQVLPILLIGAVMYVALILPQQRKTKEHRSLLSSLEEGDEVILSSGIHGFVSAIEADILWLEVADNVELKVSRAAVATKIKPPADTEVPEKESEKESDKRKGKDS